MWNSTRARRWFTVSLEWNRDTDNTRIVVAESQTANQLAFFVPAPRPASVPPSVQVRAVSTHAQHGAGDPPERSSARPWDSSL